MNAVSDAGRNRAARFLFGTPFQLVGGYFTLAGIGVLPLYSKALVPLWVIACAGLVFFIPGLTIVCSALISGRDAGPTPGGTQVIHAEEGRSGILGAWGPALFLSTLVAAFWGAMLSGSPGSGNMPDWMAVAIVGLFAVFAAAMVGQAAYLTLGALRYGEVRLQCLRYVVGNKANAPGADAGTHSGGFPPDGIRRASAAGR